LAVLQGVALDDDDLAGPVSLAVAVELTSASAGGGEPDDGIDLSTTDEEATDEEATVEEGLAEESEVSEGARLVVFGDADLILNRQIQQAGNSILITNSFNWLVERESLIAIPPKTPEQVRLNLTASEEVRIRWIVLAGLPALLLAVGAWVYKRRRR
jgi:LPXTG-motif cell wall-anchored protein